MRTVRRRTRLLRLARQSAQEEKRDEKKNVIWESICIVAGLPGCVRLESGRNYLSEWNLEQLPRFLSKASGE